MPRFILFDLDGTLIDGVDDLVNSLNVVLHKHQLRSLTRPELEAMLGDGMRMLAQRAFAARGVTLTAPDHNTACDDFIAAYKATGYEATRLYAGVTDTLKLLHDSGWQIGLASNKLTNPCDSILQRLGIRGLFSVVAGGDATHVKKPDGGHLLYALQQMGFSREAGDVAVMVGDHANDVDAARAAGIAAIAVALEVDATRASSLGADAVVTDFAVLPAVLKAIAPGRPGSAPAAGS
jgi:phosphoglycolate phosphatase